MKKMFFMLCAFCAIGAIFLMVGCSLQAYNPDTGNFSITVELPDYLASKQVTNGRLIHPDAEVLEATISTTSDHVVVATVKQSLGGKDTITLNFEDVPLDELLKLSIEVYTDIVGDVGTVKQILGTHESTFGPLKAGVNNLKVGIVPDPDFINGYLEDDGLYYIEINTQSDYTQNQIFKVPEVSKGLWYINWIVESELMDSDPTVSMYTSEGLLLTKNLTKVEAAYGSDNTYSNYFFYNKNQEDLYLLARNMPQDIEYLTLYIEPFEQSLVLTYAHTNGGQNIVSFVTDEPTVVGNFIMKDDHTGEYPPTPLKFTIYNPYPFAITLTSDAKIDYQGYVIGGEANKPNPNAFSILPAILPRGTTIPAGGKKEFTVQYAPTQTTNYYSEEAELTLKFDNNIEFTCRLSGSTSG